MQYIFRILCILLILCGLTGCGTKGTFSVQSNEQLSLMKNKYVNSNTESSVLLKSIKNINDN